MTFAFDTRFVHFAHVLISQYVPRSNVVTGGYLRSNECNDRQLGQGSSSARDAQGQYVQLLHGGEAGTRRGTASYVKDGSFESKAVFQVCRDLELIHA